MDKISHYVQQNTFKFEFENISKFIFPSYKVIFTLTFL